jgi:hypothetical protein
MLIPLAALILAAADPAPSTTPPPDIRDFRPSRHGFRFVNAFTGSPLPVSLGRLETAAGVPQTFGLCGGMSFAAADLYLARRPPPTTATPPARGTPLWSYIQRRQTESFGPTLAEPARFGRWMAAPDGGPEGTRAMSVAAMGEVAGALAHGRPAVLGLVHVRHATNRRAGGPVGPLWENHQVLAYGLSSPAPGAVRISIYDPNHPGDDDARLALAATVEASTIPALAGAAPPAPLILFGVRSALAATASRPKPVRGLFVMPYEPATPPRLD